MRAYHLVELVIALFATGHARAQDPRLTLDMPVSCAMGSVCTIQNYVDHAPGPQAMDQTCGPLATDGHRGIDIRVPTRRHMMAGVPVIAAAPGRVRVARDGAMDHPARGGWRESGDAAGNTVILEHADGWETQYSHLRRGSVAVRADERVTAGTRLGLIGLSGRTEFPHLHFAVRHDGRTRDPFTGRGPEQGCGTTGTTPLWNEAARRVLVYRGGGLLAAGFATERPSLESVLDAPFPPPSPGAGAPRLVFWAAAWGLRAGDRETIRLLAPSGAVLAQESGRIPGARAEWLHYIGRARANRLWPAGRYRGDYRVVRETGDVLKTVIDTAFEIELR